MGPTDTLTHAARKDSPFVSILSPHTPAPALHQLWCLSDPLGRQFTPSTEQKNMYFFSSPAENLAISRLLTLKEDNFSPQSAGVLLALQVPNYSLALPVPVTLLCNIRICCVCPKPTVKATTCHSTSGQMFLVNNTALKEEKYWSKKRKNCRCWDACLGIIRHFKHKQEIWSFFTR